MRKEYGLDAERLHYVPMLIRFQLAEVLNQRGLSALLALTKPAFEIKFTRT